MIGLSIDPGKENGICLFRYDEEGFRVVRLWQFPGGAEMLHAWCVGNNLGPGSGGLMMTTRIDSDGDPVDVYLDALVVEKFTPHDNEGFSLTLDSVEPLVGEGVLIAHNLKQFITWRQPSQQYFMGPSTNPLPVKKKLAKRFLETHDLLPKGSQFGRKDPNDAISATLHAVAWLRHIRHMPSINQLFPDSLG